MYRGMPDTQIIFKIEYFCIQPAVTMRQAVFVFMHQKRYAYFSAVCNAAITGTTRMPQKKLLTPWIKSHGSPAAIHASIPSKLRPYRIACTGAYKVPNKNPCSAHRTMYTTGRSLFGILGGRSMTAPHKMVHKYKYGIHHPAKPLKMPFKRT